MSKEYSNCLIGLLSQYHDLYPDQYFILAIESNDRELLAKLMSCGWDLPLSIFPLAADLPKAYKNKLLLQTGTRLLLSEKSAGISESIRVLPLSVLSQTSKKHSLKKPLEDKLDAIKLIVATSGTTSKPKAICLSRKNILAHVQSSQERIALDSNSIWLNCLPLNHVGGAMIVYRSLMADAKVLFQQQFDPAAIWQAINTQNVSHISLVPIMLEQLLRISMGQLPPNSLQMVLIGGSALQQDLYQRGLSSGWPLCVSYGSSETCSHIATNCERELLYHTGLTGLPLTGAEIKIQRDDPAASFGLIKIKGPMVMSGYANPDHIVGEGLENGWFTSTDYGYINQKGQLVVLGRADNIINSGGEKIHPELVESELRACPGILEAGIIAVVDKQWGEKVVLVYAGKWSEDMVKTWCESNLEKKYKPRVYSKVDKLPRNRLGKIKTNDLLQIISTANFPEP